MELYIMEQATTLLEILAGCRNFFKNESQLCCKILF